MKPVQKDISRSHGHQVVKSNFTRIMKYNSKSDSNKGVEFVDIDLS